MYRLHVACLESGVRLLLAGGEGGVVEIWTLTIDERLEQLQQMRLPCESVWVVASLTNGDVCAGGR
jgi:hypothetical protein